MPGSKYGIRWCSQFEQFKSGIAQRPVGGAAKLAAMDEGVE
jgi:hypothetical protein